MKLQHFDIEFRRPAGATNVLCKKHPVWALSAKVGVLYPFYRNIAMNLQTSQCSAFQNFKLWSVFTPQCSRHGKQWYYHSILYKIMFIVCNDEMYVRCSLEHKSCGLSRLSNIEGRCHVRFQIPFFTFFSFKNTM